MDIVINAATQRLKCGLLDVPVRIGRVGYVDGPLGREGDEKTPLGQYTLRFGLYRADKLPLPPSGPNGKLTFRAIEKDDGWCDAPDDPAYNRFVRLPYDGSAERLWREDGAYDIVIVMSHNDSPPQGGAEALGSAVFIHVAQFDDRQTLGCIALTPDDMAALLPNLYTGQSVQITA